MPIQWLVWELYETHQLLYQPIEQMNALSFGSERWSNDTNIPFIRVSDSFPSQKSSTRINIMLTCNHLTVRILKSSYIWIKLWIKLLKFLFLSPHLHILPAPPGLQSLQPLGGIKLIFTVGFHWVGKDQICGLHKPHLPFLPVKI